MHNSTKKVNLRKSREEKFRGEKVRQKVFKGFSDGNQIDKSIRILNRVSRLTLFLCLCVCVSVCLYLYFTVRLRLRFSGLRRDSWVVSSCLFAI